MNSYILAQSLSGFLAWFGVPALTVLAAWWLARRTGTLLRKTMSAFMALTVGIALFVWLQWFHNPLPSDATLIKHFNEHRAEFEQLMKGARNYRLQVPSYVGSEQGRQLAEKLRVAYVSGGEIIWLPDPYSARTARLSAQFTGGHTLEEREKNKRTLQEQIDFWKTNLPELFEGYAPVTEVWQLDSLWGVIRVRGLGSTEIGSGGIAAAQAIRLGQGFHTIFKQYWHYPQPPRIGDGRILTPGYGWNDEPTVRKSQRVLDSLDDYPTDWQPGECVLRRIDPHWFIAMCKSA